MKNINYALAPSSATHVYGGYWRKLEGGQWCAWIGGEWRMIFTKGFGYLPIPESEIALNRLADTTVYHDGIWPPQLNAGFTKYQWQARRAERIEAGLIEVENPTTSSLTDSQAKELNMLKQDNNADVVEMKKPRATPEEMDNPVGWLRRNTTLADWPKWAKEIDIDSEGYVTFLSYLGNGYTAGEVYGATEPRSQKWINGLPPVGVECEMAREGEMFQSGQLLFKGEKLFVFKWSDNNQEIALRYHQVKFRPIRTQEQIAAEKREAWIDSTLDEIQHWPESFIPDRGIIGHIYDALLNGELEAPKGDL